MGAWGIKVWENDNAADWFTNVMKKIDTKSILDEVEEELKYADNYENVRAATYIIGSLGKNYIWPINEMKRVEKVKSEIILYYQDMLDEKSDYMDLWENDSSLKSELLKELELLLG